jgi:hypothetical protein
VLACLGAQCRELQDVQSKLAVEHEANTWLDACLRVKLVGRAHGEVKFVEADANGLQGSLNDQ